MQKIVVPAHRDRHDVAHELSELAPVGINVPKHGAFWRVLAMYVRRAEEAASEDVRCSYERLAAKCRELAQAEDAAELAAAGLSTTSFLSDEEVEEGQAPWVAPRAAAELIMRRVLDSDAGREIMTPNGGA